MREEKHFTPPSELAPGYLDTSAPPTPENAPSRSEHSYPQLLALTEALGVDIVPFVDLPARHEGHLRVPLTRRIFIRRIGPLALQQGVDIAAEYTVEEHVLDYLLSTDMPWNEAYLQLPSADGGEAAGTAQNAPIRLYKRICRILHERKLDNLIAELEATIREEYEERNHSPGKIVDPNHPGLAIDTLRYKIIQSGETADLYAIAAKMIGYRATSDRAAVTNKKYDIHDFLLGKFYWHPARIPSLLTALEVSKRRQFEFMKLYTEIYTNRLRRIQAERPKPMSRKTAAELSPFRRPLEEDERKPPLTEIREYLMRIGPVTKAHGINLVNVLTPKEMRIFRLVEAGKDVEEIEKIIDCSRGWGSRAIGFIVDKVHFAFPVDERDEITKAVRTEIARDLFRLHDPHPDHPGPQLNALRLELMSSSNSDTTGATLQGIANAVNCQRNAVLDFFEGRVFMRPERVRVILGLIDVAPPYSEFILQTYEAAHDRVWEERRRRTWESRRKNKASQDDQS